MITSCLKMSESLLDYYDDEGGKKSSSSSRTERKLRENINEFFTDAKCLSFDGEIEDFVDDPDKKRR